MRQYLALALAPVLASQAGPAASVVPDVTLKLRASNASKAAMERIAPGCARAAGIELHADYANNPAVAKSIEDGAAFDVVVVERRMLQGLAMRGLVAAHTAKPLASLAMSVATREPGPDPRMKSVAQFKRALLGARSIGYIGNGHSGTVFLQTVDRLKLRGKLAGKLVPFDGAFAEAAEASARLQYVIAPFNTPMPAPLRLVGKFPAALNADVRLSVGGSPWARAGTAQFLDCLSSPETRTILTETGYDLPAEP